VSRPRTPDEAIAALTAGNQRFVAGTPRHVGQDAERRAELTTGQRPYAVLFGCADSRVAAEIVFDQGLGELFVVRTAGHVVDIGVLGSLEYAVTVLGTPLVVVLGHDGCGAVAATVDAVRSGRLPGGFVRDLVERVIPSVLSARADAAGSSDDAAGLDVDAIEAEHVRATVRLLVERSAVLAGAVAEGRLQVVGLVYALADGQVREVARVGT
jgi:carbonic anhydrase